MLAHGCSSHAVPLNWISRQPPAAGGVHAQHAGAAAAREGAAGQVCERPRAPAGEAAVAGRAGPACVCVLGFKLKTAMFGLSIATPGACTRLLGPSSAGQLAQVLPRLAKTARLGPPSFSRSSVAPLGLFGGAARVFPLGGPKKGRSRTNPAGKPSVPHRFDWSCSSVVEQSTADRQVGGSILPATFRFCGPFPLFSAVAALFWPPRPFKAV